MLMIHRVSGNSMLPRYRDGSYLLLMPLYRFLPFLRPAIGDALVVKHPRFGTLVKTLERQDQNGNYWLKGENPASVSTQAIGAIPKSQVIGRVLMAFQD